MLLYMPSIFFCDNFGTFSGGCSQEIAYNYFLANTFTASTLSLFCPYLNLHHYLMFLNLDWITDFYQFADLEFLFLLTLGRSSTSTYLILKSFTFT